MTRALRGEHGRMLARGRVWIAANDWRRRWGDEALGTLSIPRLPPLGMCPTRSDSSR